MEHTSDEQTGSTERSEMDYYLPGTYGPTDRPGRIERFVTNLFRRRGGLRAVVRRKGR
jgi:hypothetical protein